MIINETKDADDDAYKTHKLVDALRGTPADPKLHGGGEPAMNQEAIAEQTREHQENAEAMNNQASTRDRMVAIGRGNQQAGRQGQ